MGLKRNGATASHSTSKGKERKFIIKLKNKDKSNL